MWCWRRLLRTLGHKEIQPVHPKGNQSWVLIGRTGTEAEAEAPICCSPDVKNWLIGKDLATGKDWRQEEKGKTEGEMVGWQHWLNGHELEQALGVGDGQGGLACCSPCCHKESERTKWLKRTGVLHALLHFILMLILGRPSIYIILPLYT